MNFTFPKKPLRTSVIRTTRNDELIRKVILIKQQGYFDDVRVTA